ncbi:MAG: hypothetical protein JWR27_1455 [Aeromicrobium sp.]|nr:hypothetical protein [Aeromicrobium sp.]
MTPRHPNGFGFSDETIRRWTNTLVVLLVVVTGLGLGLGLASDADRAPSWLGTVATVVTVAGVVGPVLAAAVVGGESIRRGGGVIGVLLTYGLVAGATGHALEIGWAFWTGSIALGLGVVGFWVIGWIARVPMYIGLPWAHGTVVQRSDAPPTDHIGTDDPRLRPRRRPGLRRSR